MIKECSKIFVFGKQVVWETKCLQRIQISFYNVTFPNHQIPPCERNNNRNGKISSQTITFKAFNVINKFCMYVKNLSILKTLKYNATACKISSTHNIKSYRSTVWQNGGLRPDRPRFESCHFWFLMRPSFKIYTILSVYIRD